MQNIQSEEEYYSLVEQLYAEFRSTINDGFARNVANHVIAGFAVIERSPVVYTNAEYEGRQIQSLEGRLNPYDVLFYTNVSRLPGSEEGEPESAAIRAQEALSFDLLDLAYADHDGGP